MLILIIKYKCLFMIDKCKINPKKKAGWTEKGIRMEETSRQSKPERGGVAGGNP